MSEAQDHAAPSEPAKDTEHIFVSGNEKSSVSSPSTQGHGSVSSSHWVDTFLGTVIAPIATFKSIRAQNEAGDFAIAGPLLVVILIFSMEAIRSSSAGEASEIVWLLPVNVIGGLILWLTTAGVVALTALFFGADKAKIKSASVTLGWSLVPWIFMTPLSLLARDLGPAGHVLFLLPAFWVLALQIIALNESFSLRSWQTAVLIFVVPTLLGIAQFLQFTLNLSAVLG